MEISYRLVPPHWGRQSLDRIPTLSLYIDSLEEWYHIDLEELAEALKPFLETPSNAKD